MTILALAEHIGRSLSERADNLQVERHDQNVTYTATIGKQTFLVRIEELAKDDQEPAIT